MPLPSPSENAAIGLIKALGGNPDNTASFDLVRAWMQAEGTSNPSANNFITKINNPLDTSLKEPGSSNFNSDGVQSYPSLSEGIKANASTLNESQYSVLKKAIVGGNVKEFFSKQGIDELQTYGGFSSYSQAEQYAKGVASDYTSLTGSTSPLAGVGSVDTSIGSVGSNAQTTVSNAASGIGGAVSGIEKFFTGSSFRDSMLMIGGIIVIIVLMALIIYKGISS